MFDRQLARGGTVRGRGQHPGNSPDLSRLQSLPDFCALTGSQLQRLALHPGVARLAIRPRDTESADQHRYGGDRGQVESKKHPVENFVHNAGRLTAGRLSKSRVLRHIGLHPHPDILRQQINPLGIAEADHVQHGEVEVTEIKQSGEDDRGPRRQRLIAAMRPAQARGPDAQHRQRREKWHETIEIKSLAQRKGQAPGHDQRHCGRSQEPKQKLRSANLPAGPINGPSLRRCGLHRRASPELNVNRNQARTTEEDSRKTGAVHSARRRTREQEAA